ncbi:uncharacterized protein LOC144422121, partial [Styela clava]
STVIYAVCLIGQYSALMEPLARALQAVGVSVPSVKNLTSSLQSVIAEERNDSEIALNIYKEACEIAGLKELTIPRVVEVQVYRDNVCADSASQYFKRSVYLPYVDGLSCSIREQRFIDNPSFFSLLSILPPNKPVHVDEVERLYLLDNFQNEVRLWRTSLSSDVNDECLEGLLLSARDYPSVYTAIQIVMTLPATTVEAERSFSCMKRVKTWLRSSMTSNRLSDLCVLHCHCEMVTEEKN